jgi:uncharacterized RDD family membrane protein YckC
MTYGGGHLYANFGQRLVAVIVDALIALLLLVPAIVVLFAGPKGDIRRCTINDEPRLCRYPSSGTVAVAVILGVAAFVLFLVLYCRMVATTGQTWGRKAMHIRVVDQHTGAPIGMGRSVGRYFAHILSSFVCYLGYLWMLWDKDRQTWHDKLVQSVVIRT